jgi:hypothetical protein
LARLPRRRWWRQLQPSSPQCQRSLCCSRNSNRNHNCRLLAVAVGVVGVAGVAAAGVAGVAAVAHRSAFEQTATTKRCWNLP